MEFADDRLRDLLSEIGRRNLSSPEVGFELLVNDAVAATAELAKESVRTGIPIHQLALDRKLLDPERLNQILDARAMTQPGIAGADDLSFRTRARASARAWRSSRRILAHCRRSVAF